MYVLTHGNVTVYEWKYNEPPPNQNGQKGDNGLDNGTTSESLEIDWGDIGSSSNDQEAPTALPEIDFGESGIDFGESEIDFGVDVDLSAITIEDSGEVCVEEGDRGTAATESKAKPPGNSHTCILCGSHCLVRRPELLQKLIQWLEKASIS